MAQDSDDEKQRLFLPIKNNLASCNGLSFTIEDGRCVWNSDAVLVSADDIDESDETPRAEAKQWLESKLEKVSMPAKWILAESRKDGISERTLRRAGKELNVSTSQMFEGDYMLTDGRVEVLAFGKTDILPPGVAQDITK